MFVRPALRRRAPLPTILVLVIFSLTLLAPILDVSAQAIRTNPTPTPTEEFDPGFQAQPTEEPTREPERVPPTEVPDEPEPTDEPQPAAPSSLTLNKGACDDSSFDPYTATGLQTFLDACSSPDGEFEFTVSNDIAFSTTQSTELGTLSMQVPTGTITIAETIPDGWGDPAVFCWSNLFPAPADTPFIGNGPIWDVQEGEDVECWWFNVSEPESTGHAIRVEKRVCPEGFVVPEDYWTLANGCQDQLDGVGFALTTDGGTVDGVTGTSGEIEWTDVDLGASGQVQIQETIPEGYSEPVVWCVNFPVEAADAQDFEFFQVESTDGLVTAFPEQDAPFIFQCTYFNVNTGVAPGDLADPGQQVDGEGVAVTVVKHRCPLGVPEDTTLDQYIVICPALFEGIDFTLEHDGGVFPGTTGEDGQVEWPGVPAGEIEIVEEIPAGYKDPLAFCISFDGEQELESGQVTATGGIVPLSIPDDATAVVCYVFNIPHPDSNNTITVIKKICPPGTDTGTLDKNFYLASCGTAHEGVDFTLSAPHGEFLDHTDGDGVIEWVTVPLGDFSIQEEIPEGYGEPVVFCNFADVIQGIGFQHGPPMKVQAPGGLVSAAIEEPNVSYLCSYFNIPEAGNSLTVNKWLCPVGFDQGTGDAESECTEPLDGVTFTLDDLETTTGDFLAGRAVFLNVPEGEHELAEVASEGIDHAFIGNCEVNGEGAILAVNHTTFPSLWVEIEPDAHWVCEWYNVPNNSSSITIEKYLCPAGYDIDAPMSDPVTDCTDSYDGVTFTLADGNLPDPDQSRQTGDDGSGTVVFPDLEPGTWTVTEEVPDGIVDAAAWCPTITGNPQVFDNPPRAVFEVEEGDQHFCLWYNVPGGDNDILIHKWLCPEGFNPNSSEQEFFDTCTEVLDGITFKAMSDLGIAGLDTVGGQVGFGGFPAGMDVGIQEEIPEEYGNPYVICEFDDDQWHDVGAQAGFFEIYFAGSGETVECHVFNLHGDDPDLTILKWTCPAGYDLFAAGADPATDCTEATNGITFELRYEGDATLQQTQTTGDVLAGGVFFDDLEPDVYNVAELVPEGIASEFILECTGHIMGVLQPYPLQFGNVLDDIDLDAGEHLVCHWYNVPDDEGGDLTLIKYTCSTEGFVSEVDCQIEEDGKTFDLSYWTGTWDLVDTATTDGFGRISWTGLEPGEYWFDEHDGAWCHIASDQLYEDGPWVVVPADQETIVHVYNCDGTPGDPGDTPTKYPNTGVPPAPATPVSSQGRRNRWIAPMAARPGLRRGRRPGACRGGPGEQRQAWCLDRPCSRMPSRSVHPKHINGEPRADTRSAALRNVAPSP